MGKKRVTGNVSKGKTKDDLLERSQQLVTRISVVRGLANIDSEKWLLFLKGGLYWTYLENFLSRKSFMYHHKELVGDAINLSLQKVSRFLGEGKFKYEQVGVGFFRGFLKLVVSRTAQDLVRKESHFKGLPSGKSMKLKTDSDLSEINEELHNDLHGKQADASVIEELYEDGGRPCVNPQDEALLDQFDQSVKSLQPQELPQKKKAKGRSAHIVSLDELSDMTDDDGSASTKDEASWQHYIGELSEKEWVVLHNIQTEIVHLALGFTLADKKVSPQRRLLLHAFYIEKRPLKNIWERDFGELSRNAFDVRMANARREISKRALELWKMVAPDGDLQDEADWKVRRLWSELASTTEGRKLAKRFKG